MFNQHVSIRNPVFLVSRCPALKASCRCLCAWLCHRYGGRGWLCSGATFQRFCEQLIGRVVKNRIEMETSLNYLKYFEIMWNHNEFVEALRRLHSRSQYILPGHWPTLRCTGGWYGTQPIHEGRPLHVRMRKALRTRGTVGEAFIKDQDRFINVIDTRPTFIQFTGKLTLRMSRNSLPLGRFIACFCISFLKTNCGSIHHRKNRISHVTSLAAE